jgi:hypothetical protein
LAETTQPRLWLNAIFHTERLDDDGIFAGMLAFCRAFRELTGVVPWLCVMTPAGAIVKRRLTQSGFPVERYAERILALQEVAEIGYHGHCLLPNGERLASRDFQPEAFIPQMQQELAWLRTLTISPRIYTGGWWVVSPELLMFLARHGFRLDASTRGDRVNHHGDKYPADLPPVGERFVLVPPLTEIASLPYFDRPWPIYRATLQQMLPAWGQRDQWALMPLHDYDRPTAAGHDLRIIERLAADPSVAWMSVDQALLPV